MSREEPNPESLFAQVIEIASPEKRAAFLDQACGNDPETRREVEKLVLDHFRAGQFLERPAAHFVATVEQPIAERPGTVIGPYKLMEQIGEGGMGLVFVAEQQQPVRRKVALKIIKPGMDSRQVIARFEAERQALALMDHSNIAKVFDGGATAGGRPYFVMELVKGVPITDYCDDHRLTPRERLELFSHVCAAVQHAHQKGIIHRDIKPSNVLVMSRDGTPVVKVIDFGVAKAVGQQLTDKTVYTQFAQLVGTPLYMSPEQAGQSGVDVDTRTDIYALGVLLYELLTGTTPFDKERLREASHDEIRRLIREEEPPKPSTRISTLGQAGSTVSAQRQSHPKQLCKLVRGELDWIVMKALEKDRNRRYESASALAADVRRYLQDEPVEACPPSRRYRLGKFLRKHRTGVVTATVLLASAVALAAGLAWAARDQAVRQAVIEAEVHRALKEVQRLQDQARWPQAVEIARQTQTLLETGSGDEVLREQVRERLNDLRMILRLEEIRLSIRDVSGGTIREIEGVDIEYGKAFRGYGLDVDALRPEEAAAIIKAKSVRLELALTVDIWARVRRGDKNNDKGWKHLNAIARAADPDDWRNRFRQAWESGDEKERKASLEKLVASAKVAELLPETIVMLAWALETSGGAEQAIAFLRTAQRRHCGNYWINQGLAFMLAHASPPRYDEAIRYYSASLALRPDYPISRVDLGEAFSGKGELDEAITYYREAIRLKPDYAGAYIYMGNALWRKGELDETEAACRKAIELDPNYANAYNSLGNVLAQQQKYPEAEAVYRKALELVPNQADAYNILGVVLAQQQKYPEAEAAFRDAIELDRTNSLSYNNLGNILRDQRKLPEAEAAFRKAIELKPDDAILYTNLGVLLRGQRKLPEAEAAFRKAIELKPDDAILYTNLGVLLLNQRKLPEAEAAFRKAIELKPDDALTYQWLGTILCDQQKLSEAEAAFRKAGELDPHSETFRMRLSKLQVRQGQGEEARIIWEKELEHNPPNHGAWCGYAELCLFLGKEAEYRRARRALLERFGTTADPVVAERVGRACLLLPASGDELQQAVSLIDRAVDFRPKHQYYAFFLFAKALADYRKGKLDSAISVASAAVGPGPRLVLAMAQHQCGLRAQARKTLAAVILDPWVLGQDDWISHVLRREAEMLVIPNLEALLAGKQEPQDNDERLCLLRICQLQGLHRALARLYAKAEPKRADDLRAVTRYDAACAAALAGCGQGKDAANLEPEEYARLRGQAIAWLRTYLAAGQSQLEKEPDKAHVEIVRRMRGWQADSDFAGVRGDEALAKLPEVERQEWRKLWEEVEDLRKKAIPRGFIQAWLVLSELVPYEGDDGAQALDQKLIPGEASLRPGRGDPVKVNGKTLTWKEHHSAEPWVDFAALYGPPSEHHIAFAVCYLHADADRTDLALRVGSDDQAMIYLNGEQVYRQTQPRALKLDQDEVRPVRLRRGTNVLVFKVVNQGGPGPFGSLHFVTKDGRAAEGLRFGLEPE